MSTADFGDNRAISGKSVTHKSKYANLISENDSNPLGYIRWSDPPKDAPKK